MEKRWSVEFKKLIFTYLVLAGIPAIFFYWMGTNWNLKALYITTTTFHLLGLMILVVESTLVLYRQFTTHDYKLSPHRLDGCWDRTKFSLASADPQLHLPGKPLPRCSILIAAYLPNEQDIILETLTYILDRVHRPYAGLEIILGYNTPVDLPIEDELRHLANRHPELRLLRVKGSRSKAENLNAALKIVTGEIVCILDADHHPCPDGFVRAWHWFNQGYDVVQGRNIIRNHTQNFLTRAIAIEFESTYGISHAARFLLTDSAIFAGSNGYWRTSVLKKIRFDARMMTEDIDASLKMMSSGYRLLHDCRIIATELAPENLLSLWFQRKRWTQGWMEVSSKYHPRIWRSSKFTLRQKLYWMWVLSYSNPYLFTPLQIGSIQIFLMLNLGYLSFSNSYFLWLIAGLGFVVCVYQTLVTAKIAAFRYPILEYVKYLFLLVPFQTIKTLIAIVCLYDSVQGNRQWWITPRDKPIPSRQVIPN